jgi:DMSO/TMAO reductase YedYZ molybdopterin-dependent catalytic subunit
MSTENRSNDSADATESDNGSSTTRRFLKRRRFMQATGLVAGVALAGCSSQEENGADDDDDNGNESDEGDDDLEPDTEEYLEDKYPGLTIHSPNPANGEASERDTYGNYITPAEEFYIRNNHPTPQIEEDEHEIELRLEDDEITLTMEEIKHGYPTESVAHTMQCSGNGRSYMEPEVAGNPWEFGAVGTAVWTGTPVSAILEEYDADTSDGMWLMVAGGDAPDPEEDNIFARSLPMQKVMEDCILAYQMNGQDMTAEHGHPVRIVVPGWYGNNNVKWLAEMEVMDMMMYGEEWEQYYNWQQESYRIYNDNLEREHHQDLETFDTWDQMDLAAEGELSAAYLYDQLVKSVIGYPGEGATVSPRVADGQIEIVGVAWAGEDTVEEIEVSTDGGDSWENAELFGPGLNGVDDSTAWRQFRYLWTPEEDGEYTLLSRATDDQGRSQPLELAHEDDGLDTIEDDAYPWNADGHGTNAIWPHRVEIEVEL